MADLAETMKALADKMAAPRPPSPIDSKAQARQGAEFRYPPTITPYLPNAALAEAKAWERQGHAVFVKAYERGSELACPNCQGVGFLMLLLTASGPHSSPSPSGVLTWFDGSETHKRGWYRIEKTLTYQCPECAKRGAV